MTLLLGLKLLVFLLFFASSEKYQDHIIIWTSRNKGLSSEHKHFYVREGDNIIFNCPEDYRGQEQLYWTRNVQEYEECILSEESKMHKLLDCGDPNGGPDFLLKVTHFSEISQLPTFQNNSVVYFMSQPMYCQRHNLKMSFVMYPIRFTDSASRRQKYKLNTPHVLDDHEGLKNVQNTQGQDENLWVRYRFLFIPGILGLLTMIGIQAVICVLWKRWKKRSRQNNPDQLCSFCGDKSCGSVFCFTQQTQSDVSNKSLFKTSTDSAIASNEPLRNKHVEFISNNTHSSKLHSHIGIGTMPKHLIASSTRKINFTQMQGLITNRSTNSQSKQEYVHSSDRIFHQQHSDIPLMKTDYAKSFRTRCRDKHLDDRRHTVNETANLNMSTVPAKRVPISTIATTHSLPSDGGSHVFENVINISV